MKNKNVVVALRRTVNDSYQIEKLVNAERITVVGDNNRSRIVRVDHYITHEEAQYIADQRDIELIIYASK